MFFLLASNLTPPDITYNDYVMTLLVNDDIQGWQLEKMGTLPLWVRQTENNRKVFGHVKFFKEHFYGRKDKGKLICVYRLPGVNDCEFSLSLPLRNRNFQCKIEPKKTYRKRLNEWEQGYAKFLHRHYIALLCDLQNFEGAMKLNLMNAEKEMQLCSLYIQSFFCESKHLSQELLRKALTFDHHFVEAEKRIEALEDERVYEFEQAMFQDEQQENHENRTIEETFIQAYFPYIIISMHLVVYFILCLNAPKFQYNLCCFKNNLTCC